MSRLIYIILYNLGAIGKGSNEHEHFTVSSEPLLQFGSYRRLRSNNIHITLLDIYACPAKSNIYIHIYTTSFHLNLTHIRCC